MVSQTRLAANSLWMLLSRFAAQGLAVVFTILLARRLGSAGFGEYALIATVIFAANALTTFGTDMLLIREIAATNDLSRLPYALVLQLALSALFIGAVWAFGAWIPNQSREAIIALKIYSLALVPLAFFTVFTTALRGVQRMEVYASINVVFSLLQIGAVLLLRDKDIILLASFLLAAQIMTALCAGFLCTLLVARFWQAFPLSSFPLSSFLKEAAPIAWLALLGIIYQRLNIYLLSTLSGATETGMYSAAFRAVEASKTAHLAVFAALYPAMAQFMSLRGGRFSRRSNLLANDEIVSPRRRSRGWRGRHGDASSASVSVRPSESAQGYSTIGLLATTYPGILLTGAALICLLLFLLAKPLVALLYGPEFIPSANILQILAWTLIPFTLNTYLTLSLLASNRERLVGRALAASLLGLLVLNLWWIPAWGSEGGAWAALVAECLQSVILLAVRHEALSNNT